MASIAGTTPPAGAMPPEEEYHDDIIYPGTIPFILVHLACVAAIWTGVTATAVIMAMVLYVVRMFGTTAGYHRYFSHRSFKTGRAFQFALAFLAQSSAQRGALWWAAKHRHHHRHSDTELDIHSPRHRGFWYSHLGWIFKKDQGITDYDAVPDLTKYPELVWLDEHPLVPAVVLAVACFLIEGWAGLVVGFFWSTVVLFHGTFMINSLAHVHGNQRYVTGDDSRNNWWLALITLGEGWHNNHHAYQRSTRQGFRWWEIDITFYVLTALSWVKVVWELGTPPADVVANERRLGRAVIEKVALQLAATFPVDEISARVRDALAHSPSMQELRDRLAASQEKLETALADVHLPQIPSLAEIRTRAEAMYAASPSMDEIVERARELLVRAALTGNLRPATA